MQPTTKTTIKCNIYLPIRHKQKERGEGERDRDRDRERERGFKELANWLTQLWRQLSLQSARQISQLENQGRVHVAIQIQRQSGNRIPFFSGGP